VLKTISGEECIKILCKHFGFAVIRQKGSHIILKKELSGKTIGTVVPNHKELKMGTLKGVLELAEVEEKDFSKFL
jgi:predicted RNA binding protein YcfA (HicA-like mRNA interferase family)